VPCDRSGARPRNLPQPARASPDRRSPRRFPAALAARRLAHAPYGPPTRREHQQHQQHRRTTVGGVGHAWLGVDDTSARRPRSGHPQCGLGRRRALPRGHERRAVLLERHPLGRHAHRSPAQPPRHSLRSSHGRGPVAGRRR
jgi:hypothetical protein